MTKLKIAHILHSVGGVDVSLRLILENIDNDKFENIVVHGHDDTKSPYVDKDKREVKDFKNSIVRNISPIHDFKAILNTIKILRHEKPNVIHAHSAKGGIIGRLAGRLLGIKVLYTPQAFSYLSAQNTVSKQLYKFIEKLFANGNSVLLASSTSERLRGINEIGFKPENAIVFNNSIVSESLNKQLPSMMWPVEYICTVGRPCYQKNIEFMLDIVQELKLRGTPRHLVVMGVGYHSTQLSEVKRKIEMLNLGGEVTLLPWTSRADVLNIIDRSKLYISTARYEGLPYSVIESLMLGKPCVVSGCDGNRDLITDGFNGFVVHDSNLDRFVSHINELHDNVALYEEMSGNAALTFIKHFDMAKNIEKLEKIYTSFSKTYG